MVKRKQSARLSRYTNLARGGDVKRKTSKKRNSKPKSLWDKFWALSRKRKILIIATPILLFLIITPLVTYLMLANDIKDPERLMNRNNTGIVLLDDAGQPFYSIGRAEHRDEVKIDQISPDLKNALIASEDKDFYKHGGFSIVGIGRALILRVGGGSTITQQLVKNTLLSDERSYFRKYQELFMAIAIEQNYTKDQILEMYLNSVYFGEDVFGIAEASEFYFGKTPKDLDLAESAMLIGILPAPNSYSPISGNADYAKERQTTVLSRMVTNGYITADQKTSALAEELHYASTVRENDSIAPHFVEMVINELSEKYGYETVMRSGYQVQTTLNLDMQKSLIDSINKGMPHINAMGGSNASGIVIDDTTGEIKALVGSADYNNPDWGKVNMVLTARQPGSSFKPIYYSAALADGVVTPSTILHDVKTDFGGGYTPLDADRQFRGDVTVRSAISQSLNIPSVELMRDYSIAKSVQAAENLGITTVKKDGDYGLSLALGSVEIPLIEMTHAYAALANGGKQYDTFMIKQVKNKFDKEIFASKPQGKQVINEAGAFLISSILSDNAARAPIFGSSLTVPGNTVAVKTGTTNDNKDAWTIGYSDHYVTGVWVGNNDNQPMLSGGSDMAGPIWRNTMSAILKNTPSKGFTAPSSVVSRNVCRSNGLLADTSGPNTYMEYFLIGALPAGTCKAEPTMIEVCNKTTGQVESIKDTDYNDDDYTKDKAYCDTVKIKACDLSKGVVVDIFAKDYDSTKYSKDTKDCGNSGDTMKVCSLDDKKIVTIDEDDFDSTRYSLDLSKCQEPDPVGSP